MLPARDGEQEAGEGRVVAQAGPCTVKQGEGSFTLPLACKQSGGGRENFPVFRSEQFVSSCVM